MNLTATDRECPSIHVLIVEDDPLYAETLQEVLSSSDTEHYEFTLSDSLASALSRLTDTKVDLILLDLGLPDSYEMETFERIRGLSPGAAVVILTALVDENLAREAVQKGAQDYLVKGQMNNAALLRAVRHAYARHQNSRSMWDGDASLTSLLQDAVDGVVLVDKSGTIRFANPTADNLLALGSDRILNQVRTIVRQSQRSPVTIDMVNGARERISVELHATEVSWRGESLYFVNLRNVTQRVQALEALRQYEQRYRSLLDSARDLILTISDTGTLTSLNLAFETTTGWSRAEWVGKDYAGMLHEDDRDRAQQSMEDVVHGTIASSIELRIRTRSESYIIADFTATPRFEDDRIVGVLLIGRDITDRKHEEEVKRETEMRYRLMVEGSDQVFFYAHDREHRFEYLSPSVRNVLGYEPSELFGQPYSIITSDTPQNNTVDELTDGALKDGQRRPPYKVLARHKEGYDVSLELVESPIVRNDKVVGIQGYARNITGRERAESENARLVAAIEHAAESIVITDAEGRIQFVNPAFERITGYTREEVLGQNPRILKSGKQDDAYYKQMWETITRGEVWTGHLINKRKDGTAFEEKGTISPVFDGTGEIVNYVSVKRDVSQEASLERQLRQAQKMEAIGTLAGGIAHDFNNILAAILGYCDMAMEEIPKESRAYSDLERVLAAGERAKDLVLQILTFSRQVEEERRPLLLHSVMNEALKLLRATIPATIEIQAHIIEECGAVLADPTQIHQIVMNLCTNAYHAMKQTGGTMVVSLDTVNINSDFAHRRAGLTEGRYARITVEDTGRGMDKSTVERIFEPFFTTKDAGEGTGLGLATVHGIVKAHGGDITVYSEAGHGTVFHVYLPCIESVSLASPHEDEQIQGGNERILVIDDETDLVDISKRFLERLGYAVTAVTNSLDALAAVRERPQLFDLVITDHAMPAMTGRELAEQLASVRPDLPVILVTGFSASPPSQTDHLQIHSVLIKPIEGRRLAKEVRDALDKRTQT